MLLLLLCEITSMYSSSESIYVVQMIFNVTQLTTLTVKKNDDGESW